MENSAKYQRYMNERIRIAMAYRKAYGKVPDEETLDKLVPVPSFLSEGVAISDTKAVYLARITKRDQTYGICGICRARGKWVGRMEFHRKQWTKTCKTAVEAVRWYNRMESKLRKKWAVLASLKAAALVDAGVIPWDHISAITRGKEFQRPEILKLLEDDNG